MYQLDYYINIVYFVICRQKGVLAEIYKQISGGRLKSVYIQLLT